jgi:hypothetical protein
MREVIVSVPEKNYPFFMQLIKSLDFTEVKEPKEKAPTKKEFLDGLKEAVKEVKLIKAGKLKGISAKDLLNEL